MIKKTGFLGVTFVVLTVCLLLFIGYTRTHYDKPHDVYQVYLDGKKIGLLDNKRDLLNIIDKTQQDIKKRFNVDKVYPPEGLKAIKYTTYSKNIQNANEIYSMIEDKSNFTIKGYIVTIKPDDGDYKYINILNKEDLEPALLSAASAFLSKDKIEAFINNTQIEITETGIKIENLYFQEKITIKESFLSVDDLIITNQEDLTKYLLFGTLEKQAEYTVQEGDTVSTVAYNNKLSNEELLIANPNLSSVKALLSKGQKLNIGLINPLFTMVEEAEVVEDVSANFETIYEDNDGLYASQSYVKQEGSNGVERLTEKILYKNGEIMTLAVSAKSVITPPTDKIIVRGTKKSIDYSFNSYPPAASSTDWGWPTTSPYVIMSYFGYRWGKLHGGLDISGTGFGSPIYSATSGTVISVTAVCADNGYYGSSCGRGYGNAVVIQSDTGLIITYAHLKKNIIVSIGQRVSKGQPVGYMGNSGSSTGTHLHYQIEDTQGIKYDPCKVAYKC